MRAAVLLVALGFAATPVAAQRGRVNVADLEARARRDSLDSGALYELAVGYMSAERWSDADTLLRQIVTIDPRFAVGYFALGLVQERNARFWNDLRRSGGDSAVARERVRREAWSRKAFLVDPFVDVRLLGRVTRRRSYGAKNYFSLAMESFIDGAYGSAFGLMSEVRAYVRQEVAIDDSLPPVILWIRALAGARSGQYREAIGDIEILVRLELAHEHDDSTHVLPLNTGGYRYMLAALHQRLRQNTLAIQLYEQVLAEDVGNYMAHVQLARIHESERGWFGAVRERRLAVEVNPEDHTLLYDLGATLSAAGRWPEAEDALVRARDMQPRYPHTWRALGIAQQELGKRVEARQALERYVAVAPSRDSAAVSDAQARLSRLAAGPEQ